MIKIAKCEHIDIIDAEYAGRDDVAAHMAVDASGVLGHCVYKVENGELEILKLSTKAADLPLADGIFRAVLAANEKLANTAHYVRGRDAGLDEYAGRYRVFGQDGRLEIAAFFGSPGC